MEPDSCAITKVALEPPNDWVGVTSSDGTEAVGRIQQAVGVVVFRRQRQADQIVVVLDTFLGDLLLLAAEADADRPVGRQLAVELDLLRQRLLVVGVQALLDRAEVDLQRLIARQEVRLDELGADIVAGLLHRIAAELDAGGEVELLGVAEQIAVVPADVER